MNTPEELLCSRRWRLRHSLWMLWGWFPFALTAWVGYLIIGVKARNWRWILTAVGFFIFGCIWIGVIGWVGGQTNVQKGEVAPEPYATYTSIAMITNLLLWLGNAAGVQWWINRKWLVWRAHNDKNTPKAWYATVTATGGGHTPSPANPHQVSTVMDTAFAYGSASTASAAVDFNRVFKVTPTKVPIDINTATEDDFAALPGIDAATAQRVVVARNQAGGFRETAELVTHAGVKPHVFAGLVTLVTASTKPGSVTPTGEPERAPSSKNGRRLEF